MAHMLLCASPITLEDIGNMVVGLSKFQVSTQKKMFVSFLIEIEGLMITTRKKSIFKSITSTPKPPPPHPHNVHLMLCVEKSICESSLIKRLTLF